ncbi:hypothetical protein [Zobellella denitrificans]|nr:hypothetical protein [Zobellella denitrificans]
MQNIDMAHSFGGQRHGFFLLLCHADKVSFGLCRQGRRQELALASK